MMNIKRIFRPTAQFQNQDGIILRDYLAMERTKLANERTLLSYIRSSMYLLIGGIALIQLEGFENIKLVGYIALALTVIFLIIGIYRFYKLKKILENYYRQIELLNAKDVTSGNNQESVH